MHVQTHKHTHEHTGKRDTRTQTHMHKAVENNLFGTREEICKNHISDDTGYRYLGQIFRQLSV